jgi:hypothetical protein
MSTTRPRPPRQPMRTHTRPKQRAIPTAGPGGETDQLGVWRRRARMHGHCAEGAHLTSSALSASASCSGSGPEAKSAKPAATLSVSAMPCDAGAFACDARSPKPSSSSAASATAREANADMLSGVRAHTRPNSTRPFSLGSRGVRLAAEPQASGQHWPDAFSGRGKRFLAAENCQRRVAGFSGFCLFGHSLVPFGAWLGAWLGCRG